MPNKQRFGQEEENLIVAIYEKGSSAKKIAEKLGAGHQTVLSVLKKKGVRLRRKKERFVSKEKLYEMCSLYESGASFQDVAERFGLSWDLVNRLLKEEGVVVRPAGFRKGMEHHAWKGGRHTSEDGYVRVWLTDDHPFYCMAQSHSAHGGYVLEHRLVMAQKLGRPLREEETVHHMDGNRQNNHPDNLQLRQGKHGNGAAFCCADCGSYNVISAPIAEGSA